MALAYLISAWIILKGSDEPFRHRSMRISAEKCFCRTFSRSFLLLTNTSRTFLAHPSKDFLWECRSLGSLIIIMVSRKARYQKSPTRIRRDILQIRTKRWSKLALQLNFCDRARVESLLKMRKKHHNKYCQGTHQS